jgi:hypothetical protein
LRRFNQLAAALILQFQPRNSGEVTLVPTMTAARWRLLRMWGIQTLQREMARLGEGSIRSAGSGATLAAVTFQSLADNSRAPALQHRLEATYDLQYNHARAMLLKLREAPNSSVPSYPSIDPVAKTWDDDFQCEANFEAVPLKGSSL